MLPSGNLIDKDFLGADTQQIMAPVSFFQADAARRQSVISFRTSEHGCADRALLAFAANSSVWNTKQVP